MYMYEIVTYLNVWRASCQCFGGSHKYLSLVMRKTPFFANAKTKTQISCAVTAQLISAFVFAIRTVPSLFFLNPKFQASNYLLWLYSPVCVGPGRNPEDRFSQNETHLAADKFQTVETPAIISSYFLSNYITKTCPCFKHQIFHGCKKKIFR